MRVGLPDDRDSVALQQDPALETKLSGNPFFRDAIQRHPKNVDRRPRIVDRKLVMMTIDLSEHPIHLSWRSTVTRKRGDSLLVSVA